MSEQEKFSGSASHSMNDQLIELVKQHEIEIRHLKQEIEMLKKEVRSNEKEKTASVQAEGAEELIVYIESDLEDLIPDFLENRKEDVSKAIKSLAKNDFNALSMQGHNLKGVGDSYGFSEISRIGKCIEHEANLNNEEALHEWIQQLSDYLKNVKVLFR